MGLPHWPGYTQFYGYCPCAGCDALNHSPGSRQEVQVAITVPLTLLSPHGLHFSARENRLGGPSSRRPTPPSGQPQEVAQRRQLDAYHPPYRDWRHERTFGFMRPDGSLKPHAEVLRRFAATHPQVLRPPAVTL